MTKDYKALIKDISQYVGELGKLTPDALKGFRALGDGATQDGALSEKTKELIALGIGVASRCDGCIGFHTKALKELGATLQEIAETLATAVYMGGGPVLMYAADALRAFDQLSA